MHKPTIIILTTGTDEKLECLDKLLMSISTQTVRHFQLTIASEVLSYKLEKLLRKYFYPCEDHKILATGYWNKCRTANKAIKDSKGDIIFLLEDDLVLKEDFMEKILKTFDSDPRIGCVYSRCIWVYPEGLRSKEGFKSFIAKLVTKLSVHGSALHKYVKKVDEGLYEVPTFTMSVACRKEALYKAGLFDEYVEEPILGEDYDLALRVKKAGYRIVQNLDAVSYHYTKQVSKSLDIGKKDPKKFAKRYESEVYFMAKNRDVLGILHVLMHAVYRIIEGIAWSIKMSDLKVLVYGLCYPIKGLVKGLCIKSYSMEYYGRSQRKSGRSHGPAQKLGYRCRRIPAYKSGLYYFDPE